MISTYINVLKNNLIGIFIGAVAKLIFISNVVLFVFRRETEFANLNTFYYISCPPMGDKIYMDSYFATALIKRIKLYNLQNVGRNR